MVAMARETEGRADADSVQAQTKALLKRLTGVEWLTTAEAAALKGASPDHIRDFAQDYLKRAAAAGVEFPDLLPVSDRELQAYRVGASVRKSSLYVSRPSVEALRMNMPGPDGRPLLHRTGKIVGWKPQRPYGHRKPKSEDLRYRATRIARGLPTQA